MALLRSRMMLPAGLLVLLLTVSMQVMALPFPSLDPRTFSMGGAGVASGGSASAGFLNPALLVTARERKDVAIAAPIAAWRIMDPLSLSDEIDRYQGNELERAFEEAMSAFKDPGGAADEKIRGDLRSSALDIIGLMGRMSEKSIDGERLVAVAVGIPSKTSGMSLMVSSWSVGGAKLFNKAQDMQAFTDVVTAIEEGVASIDDDAYAIELNPAVGRTLTGGLQGRGAVLREISISVAREYTLYGHDLVLGVTPKYVRVVTFDYLEGLNVAGFNYDTNTKAYSSVNVDVGVTRDYSNGWKTGLVVKNLIPQSFKTALNNKVYIFPQVRAGFSRRSSWGTTALDLDLNESKAIGLDSKTQYISMGVEFDLIKAAQIRVGYRHNISNRDTSILTFGAGVVVMDAYLELAVGLNEDKVGASVQLGFGF